MTVVTESFTGTSAVDGIVVVMAEDLKLSTKGVGINLYFFDFLKIIVIADSQVWWL